MSIPEYEQRHVLDAAWQDARLSVLPDHKGAPELMFNPPSSWLFPDNAWQAAHQGWLPPRGSIAMPVEGWGLPILGHRFWLPRAELLRKSWRLRRNLNIRYGGMAGLYCFGVVILTTWLFSYLGPVFAIIALLASMSYAVLPALLCIVYVFLSAWIADALYVRLARSQLGRKAQFWMNFALVCLIDLISWSVVVFGSQLFLDQGSFLTILPFAIPFLPVGGAMIYVYMQRELGFEDLEARVPNTASTSW
jgi:hypothetical protein